MANSNSNATILGDEPFQFYKKFSNIQVAVDADRKNGIEQLLSQSIKPDVILLDDAFQHRKVKAGFYILLTSYGDLYSDDFLLPTGNLRESRSGAQRANIIIVTKCPINLTLEEQFRIKRFLLCRTRGQSPNWRSNDKGKNQELYFSYIDYDDFVYSENQKIPVSEIKSKNKLLVAGIAKPQPFFNYLENKDDSFMTFPDHHNFTEKDIVSIQNQAMGNVIITTEKDYVRLKDKITNKQLYYLSIRSSIMEKGDYFDKSILEYLKKAKLQNR